jgi:glycosyltransferase involved in cell wall biosynthesis
MRVLIAHNTYQQPGGEDTVVSAEKDLLIRMGNEVSEYTRHNSEIKSGNTYSNIALGLRTIWSSASRDELYNVLKNSRPEIVQFHNTFPLISPAAYYACQDLGIPVIQTLHNYRLFCPAANFFREGKVCEDCLGKSPWQAVRHRCYRKSRSASAALAGMLSFHRWYGTWANLIDRYIALSEFSRAKFVEAGLPPEKIVVKPNFVLPDPGVRSGPREYALFLGRLSEEKGLPTLLQAWTCLEPSRVLRIIGDGPLQTEIRTNVSSANLSNVYLDGRLPRKEALRLLQCAKVLILPSTCYENFPMSIVEAYACGTPVIASRLGAMQEIVQDGRTGLHFTPGDANDLARKAEWAWAHPEEMREMGRNARAEYEAKYTADRNYKMLRDIYQRVIQGARKSMPPHNGKLLRVVD